MLHEMEKQVSEPDESDALQTPEEAAEPVPPPWTEQITVRAVVAAAILVFLLCLLSQRTSLGAGVTPALSVPAGLLGFFFIKTYTLLLQRIGIVTKPFTPQENTVIQTCAVAGAALVISGGFGYSLLAMDFTSYEVLGPTAGNSASDVVEPVASKVFPLMFLTGFLGIFFLVNIRRMLIIDFRLPWPSSTATGVLINSFHHAAGEATAWKQMRCLLEWFAAAFLFSFFKWFFSGRNGASCGFGKFPFFGERALRWQWQFDFQLIYVGSGMICPYLVPASMMLGAIVSWGIMWPVIATKRGEWYPEEYTETSYSFQGLYGYKVFLAIALILGDALYNLVKVMYKYAVRLNEMYRLGMREQETSEEEFTEDQKYTLQLRETYRERMVRTKYFKQEGLPWWTGITGYLFFAVLGVACIPQLYPQVKWYYVLICYFVAPPLSIANAFSTALTDQNFASTYGKLAIFLFAAWSGPSNNGIIVGNVICNVVMACIHSGTELMQDFRTGYLTCSSSKAMFLAQIIGALMGCILAPASFYLIYNAFPDIGHPGSAFPVTYGPIYRGIAAVGVSGLGTLPKYCLWMCLGWFLVGIGLDILRDLLPKRYAQFVPIPMAVAVPFYLGAYLSVDFARTCGSGLGRAPEQKDSMYEKEPERAREALDEDDDDPHGVDARRIAFIISISSCEGKEPPAGVKRPVQGSTFNTGRRPKN
ncbi:hypothetical protein WJX84_007164 [Apatococcus fuscideae]|uniref:Uncharacterized protein n=1 Tax=Apatococcus fuscideae TaxID=2026836 RepID=A0AAW1THE8_9CHLO